MFTGIEKGYEKWLEVEAEADKFSEHGELTNQNTALDDIDQSEASIH